MRDFKLEQECDKLSILHLCKNNHTSVYACGKEDNERALRMFEKLKYRHGKENNRRKKFFVITFETFSDSIYTVYTAIPN